MPPPAQLAALRQLLAERFPAAHRPVGRVLPTGLAGIDEPAGGGLPQGAVTEVVCAAPSCGGTLLLSQLLTTTRAQRLRMALVDTSNTFDPASHPADLLAHLVWVRGEGDLSTALAATDLLARDANLGLVVLDLRDVAWRNLQRTPSTLWYRLQRAVEGTDLALVVETPRALVPSAQLRLALAQPFPLTALTAARPAVLTACRAERIRQRLTTLATG